MTEPAVSAVVVSHNTRDDLLRCVASLRDHAQIPIEVIVVDNASGDGSVEAVRRDFPAVRVIASPENLGFSRANNLGIREARAPYVLILNSDAEVRPGAVAALAAVLDSRNDVAVVGPRTLSSDGTIQVSFGPALSPLAEWKQRRLVSGVRRRDAKALREAGTLAEREHEPDWVSASCLLARRRALDAIGGFDEGFFLYEEDVDLCVRLRRAGWRVVFTPTAEVVHHLGRSMEHAPSRARLEYHRSHLRYYRKHNGVLANVFLRALLLGQGVAAWVAALGPGDERRERRAEAKVIVRLGVSG